MFLCAAVTLVVFAFIQFKFKVPEGWTTGLQSPYEDIFSYGGVAVSVFVFFTAIQARRRWTTQIVQILCSFALLILVITSWSRGVWLAAAIFLFVIAWFRLPRWSTMVLLGVAGLSVAFINANAQKPLWQKQEYLARLVSLVRVEKLSEKSAGRFDLYHRALGMIHERPLLGHGIGSFYMTSPHYTRPGDSYRDSDFAHNAFLQLAAEQGVLVAGLFAALVGWAVWRGLRVWLARRGSQQAADFEEDLTPSERLTLLGTTLALGVYVQTNLTSNSLNIHASNQFFFWFLMAALLSKTPPDTDGRIRPIPSV